MKAGELTPAPLERAFVAHGRTELCEPVARGAMLGIGPLTPTETARGIELRDGAGHSWGIFANPQLAAGTAAAFGR